MDPPENSRVADITQSRRNLILQLIEFSGTLGRGDIDVIQAKLYFQRLMKLFHSYETMHNELATLDPHNEGLETMTNIRNEYNAIASKIESMSNQEKSQNNVTTKELSLNSTFIEMQHVLKLRIADLPTFSGDPKEWLSFAAKFKSMVHDREEITEAIKFLYLKNCLQGSALQKLAHFESCAASYRSAWKILKESYENKRLLITKHMCALLDLSIPSTSTTSSLSTIIDTAKKNLNVLESLGVKLNESYTICILERALPVSIQEEWEKSLKPDKLPTLQQFFAYINKIIFGMDSRDQSSTRTNNENHNEIRMSQQSEPISACGMDSQGQNSTATSNGNHNEIQMSLQPEPISAYGSTKPFQACPKLTLTNFVCGYCSDNHETFRCKLFMELSIEARRDVARVKAICHNCLGKHKGRCLLSTHCKICSKQHHTLLHSSKWRTVNKFGFQSANMT